MFNKKQSKRRIILLSSLIITLLLIYICQTWLLPTLTRYIHREQDEIRAYYTALYIDSTGEGKTICLENSVGYVNFDLRNYVGENVTQRDIVYSISKPSVFYDEFGNEIDNALINDYLSDPANDLHILDVWGNPQKVARSSYLYNVEITENNGEVVSSGTYAFTYEKLNNSAKGKVHSITCKVTREDGQEPLNDEISLVVQLTKPYKEAFIINMKVSNRLISFAHKEIETFHVPMDKIYVQTQDLFAYHKDGLNTYKEVAVNETTAFRFTSYAIKLTISWSGYVLDELGLENIHIGTSPYPGSDKWYDSVDQFGNVNNSGAIPNANYDLPYLDIKQSTIARLNSLYDAENGHSGELIIFVPQGSDFFLNFIKDVNQNNRQGSIDVKIETYVSYVVDGEVFNSNYRIYSDTELNGYEHIDNLYNLASYNYN